MILIIQTSLSKNSKTAITANKTLEILKSRNIDCDLIDLRDYDLEFCDGRKIEDYNLDVQTINKKVLEATSYILAYPVYNYSISGVCKNFIDLFSYSMDSKTIGIINNSAGIRSANEGISEVMRSLGMHNKVRVVFPHVHSFRDSFENDELVDEKVVEKINEMVDALTKNQ